MNKGVAASANLFRLSWVIQPEPTTITLANTGPTLRSPRIPINVVIAYFSVAIDRIRVVSDRISVVINRIHIFHINLIYRMLVAFGVLFPGPCDELYANLFAFVYSDGRSRVYATR